MASQCNLCSTTCTSIINRCLMKLILIEKLHDYCLWIDGIPSLSEVIIHPLIVSPVKLHNAEYFRFPDRIFVSWRCFVYDMLSHRLLTLLVLSLECSRKTMLLMSWHHVGHQQPGLHWRFELGMLFPASESQQSGTFHCWGRIENTNELVCIVK